MILADDSWYARSLGLTVIADLARGPLWRIVIRSGPGRGLALWWFARRRRAVVVLSMAGSPTRALLLLERLFGGRRQYLVLLEFIPVLSEDRRREWGERSSLRMAIASRYLSWIVKPALARCLLVAQSLTQWEIERNTEAFDLPAERFRLIPWYGSSEDEAEAPTDSASERIGVLSSGRAACDWETVFAAARGEPWPLTVVCSAADLPAVSGLNHDGRATVLSEIPVEEHAQRLQQARVYLIALREAEVSSGQVRLNHATRAGTPVVASAVQGLRDYVVPEETALMFGPGDHVAARAAVNRVYGDPELARRLVAGARERGRAWGREHYLEAVRSMVQAAAERGVAAGP